MRTALAAVKPQRRAAGDDGAGLGQPRPIMRSGRNVTNPGTK